MSDGVCPPGLVALDLDGTLVDHASHIPAAHRAAVSAIQAMGIPVALVTGRPVAITRPIWQSLGLDTPAVCFNGTWLGRLDGDTLHEVALSEADVRRIVDCLRPFRHGVINCYRLDGWYINRITPRTRDWCVRYGTDAIHLDPQLIHHWQGPSPKVMFVAEPDDIAVAFQTVRQQLGTDYHVVMSQDDRFEIHCPGVTKAWGLSHLAALLEVPQQAVWAAGDGYNDREMLHWAGVSCVMGQAAAEIKALGTYVLPSISEQGLAALPGLLERARAA